MHGSCIHPAIDLFRDLSVQLLLIWISSMSGFLVLQEEAELHLCNAIRQPGSVDHQVLLVEDRHESLHWKHLPQAHNLQQGCVSSSSADHVDCA